MVFENSCDVIGGTRTVFGFILETIPDSRIVAGCDNNCPACVQINGSIAYHRCGCCSRTEVYPDPGSSDHFRGCHRKIFRSKPCVIADYQSFFSKPNILQVCSYGTGADTYIIESKIIGNNPTPAVCSKFYRVFSQYISFINCVGFLLF